MGDSQTCWQWLEARRKASRMTCAPIDWRSCASWRLEDGVWAHRTGRFFSIVGLRTRGRESEEVAEQPFILQPEVGLLGFVLRTRAERTEVLVQAKSEPGNIDIVQLAPSVQATVSNYTRVHGGAATPHLEVFERDRARSALLADGIQSEQGTRFLGKFNRNAVARVDGAGPDPVSDVWSWWPVGTLLGALRRDFAVNTDARSVLVCAPWGAYCDQGSPFDRHSGSGRFGEELRESYRAADSSAETAMGTIDAWLSAWRRRRPFAGQVVPLGALSGWRLEDEGLLALDEHGIDVRAFETRATDREVSHWMQPLVAPRAREEIVLLCQRRRGVLHFLLRAAAEPGFRDGVQLGPSIQTRDGRAASDALGCEVLEAGGGHTVAAVRQSDEGGRFHRSVGRYRVIRWPDRHALPELDDALWVTLAQIQALALRPGLLTNEARSVISLLLTEI